MLYSRELLIVSGSVTQREGVCQMNQEHRLVSARLTFETTRDLSSGILTATYTTLCHCQCGKAHEVRSTFESQPEALIWELVSRLGSEVLAGLGLPASVERLQG